MQTLGQSEKGRGSCPSTQGQATTSLKFHPLERQVTSKNGNKAVCRYIRTQGEWGLKEEKGWSMRTFSLEHVGLAPSWDVISITKLISFFAKC